MYQSVQITIKATVYNISSHLVIAINQDELQSQLNGEDAVAWIAH